VPSEAPCGQHQACDLVYDAQIGGSRSVETTTGEHPVVGANDAYLAPHLVGHRQVGRHDIINLIGWYLRRTQADEIGVRDPSNSLTDAPEQRSAAMTTRQSAPLGSPCWADLWTSDVAGSRAFYSEVFGWEAQEPSPEFGGYFMFTRDGVPVAGAMGDMGDMPATNTWKVYLNTDDLSKALQVATDEGAQILGPAMPIADLGIQAVLTDPSGANVGLWEPGTFPGFTVLGEHGAPSWFELQTRDYPTASDFYRTVFHWEIEETEAVAENISFRYALVRNPDAQGELAGLMDASSFPNDGAPAGWSIYWEVDDPQATIATVVKLGGTVVSGPEETPYGRIATVTDPCGAEFRLRAQSR
jgi:predicted enzyme related to lactoylglutathione lyase